MMDGSTFAAPRLDIEANGSPLAPEITERLSAVLAQQRLSLPAQIELTFAGVADTTPLLAPLAPGSTLRVRVAGYAEPLFSGEVTALGWRYGAGSRRELVVRGYDALYRLRQRQSLRTFANVTTAELAARLAGEIGLAPPEAAAGPRWPRLYQHRQSDLALLQEVAARSGLYPLVREGALRLVSLAGYDEDLLLRMGENLVEAEAELNVDAACQSLEVLGWDPQRSVAVEATATRSGLHGLVAGQPRAGTSNGPGCRALPDETALDPLQAAAFVQAELDRREASRIVLRGLARGDPGLQPGRVIRVEGLADAVNGRYAVTTVDHAIDARRGFVSRLSTEPPEPPVRPRAALATLGVVVQVDDPEQCGRVRVALPAYGNVETGWIGVLSVAAGPGKGLVALPDIGDTVLVLLVHEDLNQGLVLGGLYGQKRLADSGVENGAVKRFSLRTADGQLIQLDDRSVRLKNGAGSYVELSPDQLCIFSKTDLTIEAPGKTIRIRGNAIDFEQG